jgi:uncharacterized protein YdbL (DUF1318 family)
MIHMSKYSLAAALGASLAVLAVAAPASAQRDPAYAAARSAGQIGERMDGYLGVVGTQPAAVRSMVDDLNIKRRENYTERATAQGTTIEAYAVTQGCVLIARTVPGEKYQAPDGSWQTRDGSPPQRAARCP